MNEAQNAITAAIVERLSMCPEVVAIALGGSIAADVSDERSDVDLYIFTDGDVRIDVRTELAHRFDPAAEIDNRFFGPTDEWRDRASGVIVDLTFWDRYWFEDQLARVIDRHLPSLGYTTAFWYTMRHAIPLYDRTGWLAAIQEKSHAPYPAALRTAIIAFNEPLLCRARSSFRRQIELALARDDPVSVNHRLAAFLASLFDIIFAANLKLHPGEKRLLIHAAALPSAPEDLVVHVRALLAVPDAEVMREIDALCEALNRWLNERGLVPASSEP